jgi:hypothetical protein
MNSNSHHPRLLTALMLSAGVGCGAKAANDDMVSTQTGGSSGAPSAAGGTSPSAGGSHASGGANANAGGSNAAGGATSAMSGTSLLDAGPDASESTCTIGDQRPCTGMFGCPGSKSTCQDGRRWGTCSCGTCEPYLDAGTCSWTMLPGTQFVTIGANVTSSKNTVIRIDPDGGQTTVPMAVDAAACQPGGGYYAITEDLVAFQKDIYLYQTQSLTFTLCPTSCAERQASPDVVFQLLRGGFCPIE